MALNASKIAGGKEFKQQDPIESGSYPGRLVQIIDLGLQPQRPYQGQDKEPCQEIMLTYELVDEFMKDEEGNDILDKPRWISETIPFKGLKAEKAKSTLRYKALDPSEQFGGDFASTIETPVNVLVTQNPYKDKIYNNVQSISPMRPRDAAACPQLVNPSTVFDLDNPNKEVFGKFPPWVQDKLRANLNFNGSPLQKLVGNAPAERKEPVKKEEKPVIAAEDQPDAGSDNPY